MIKQASGFKELGVSVQRESKTARGRAYCHPEIRCDIASQLGARRINVEIALVSIIDDVATYQTLSAYPVDAKPPAWLNLPKFTLWHVGENDGGNITMKSLGGADTELNEMFGDYT